MDFGTLHQAQHSGPVFLLRIIPYCHRWCYIDAGGTPTAASFTVTGVVGATYDITLPAE